ARGVPKAKSRQHIGFYLAYTVPGARSDARLRRAGAVEINSNRLLLIWPNYQHIIAVYALPTSKTQRLVSEGGVHARCAVHIGYDASIPVDPGGRYLWHFRLMTPLQISRPRPRKAKFASMTGSATIG